MKTARYTLQWVDYSGENRTTCFDSQAQVIDGLQAVRRSLDRFTLPVSDDMRAGFEDYVRLEARLATLCRLQGWATSPDPLGPHDLRVLAVRNDRLVGFGTCSTVDEVYSDQELAERLDELEIADAREAVEWARRFEEIQIERALDCRWGEDNDPELARLHDWERRKEEVLAAEKGGRS